MRFGADALGLVSEMPSGPGPISDSAIARICAQVPPPVATFLLTSRTEPDAVVAHILSCRPSVVQLVDSVPTDTYKAIRHHCPSVRIVQAVHVEDERAIHEALWVAPKVDALLLDSGRPLARVRELGGTGRTHDWALSRRIVERSRTPVFLAGGLRAENVSAGLAQVKPFAVDVCSGVRTQGALDGAKLEAFMSAIETARLDVDSR